MDLELFSAIRQTRIVVDGHAVRRSTRLRPVFRKAAPLSPILYILYNAGLIEECATPTRQYCNDDGIY